MGNKYFGASQDALRMMIPLVINQRNIEANAAEQQRRLDFLRQQGEEQTARALAELEDEKNAAQQKAQTAFLLKRLETAETTGDRPAFEKLAPMVEQRMGTQLPKYFSAPEGLERYHMGAPKQEKESLPNTLESVLARNAKTPEDALKMKKELIRFQQQQEQAFSSQTADEKLPPMVKAAMDFLRANPDDKQMSTTNALIAGLVKDPAVLEVLKGQGAAPETQRLRQQSQAILEAYYKEKMGGAAPAAAPVGDDPLGLRKR